MSGYYDEILEEIRQAISEGKLEDARFLLKKELSMPYIPEDVEPQLLSLKREIAYGISSQKSEEKEESLNSLLNRLHGKASSQLSAAGALSERNLRICIDEIRDYLQKDPVPEAAAVLIEALAEQEISEEFTFVRNGLEYSFWPDSITPIAESPGFCKALEILNRWFSKNPTYQNMAKSQLIHEAFLYLPLSYEEDEAYTLADSIAASISDMMDGGETYAEIQAMEQNRKAMN